MPDAPWACRAVRSTAKDVDACLAEAPVPGCPDRDVRGGLEGFGEVVTYGMRAGRDLLWGRFRRAELGGGGPGALPGPGRAGRGSAQSARESRDRAMRAAAAPRWAASSSVSRPKTCSRRVA